MNWNRAFTDLIRNGRPAYWGNWTLSPKLAPGAVGIVTPDTGAFTLVKESTPGIAHSSRTVANQWKLSSNNVHRTETQVNLDGSGTDPNTGTKIKAGLEVKWEFSSAGAIASEFSIESEKYINDLTSLSKPETLKWLAEQAQSVSMGSGGSISQGFGVITSAIYAHSGVNAGSQDNSSSFALTGSASAVHDMLGGANGRGSYLSVNQQKSVDQHLWPFKPSEIAPESIPIAYTVASFDGNLLIPNWITRLGAFEIYFNNKPGCTYITHIKLAYDTPQGRRNDEFSLTGGISKTVGNIPLSSTNIHVEVKFQGVANHDEYTFHWATPLGQWLTGRREIEMSGVWPGSTHAREV